ncbi:MAG: tryptophan synthase alpha chain [Phycisphaerae bacterium]|nr:MAG: tryptophan synthase subunit alpha [Planctomycetia bacterium]RIK71342.1 MAG: tryptophan synthase subunit alpha [Planctomycetota bacterium]GJQ26461.1 MAG: tryptophan synthase alpha chain [Phycisphaerae bacterium]
MTSPPPTNRIDRRLVEQPPGLWPFIPAGFPSLAFTEQLLTRLAALPIRGVELGIPFSDPIADGPVIQHAFAHALAAGVRLVEILAMVTRVRSAFPHPLLAMVSASIVYRRGADRFVEEASHAGFDGLIVPDLPLEEAADLADRCAAQNMRLSMLVAPTTPPERAQRIARAAGGFLYYVSVQGTTGERAALPTDLAANVTRIREQSGRPVLIGFGIGTADQVHGVCSFADGAIVGSALVRRIHEAMARGGESGALAAAVDFVRELAVGDGGP